MERTQAGDIDRMWHISVRPLFGVEDYGGAALIAGANLLGE
jgi:hypothetical protein